MEVKVNQEVCIGCGVCASICPAGFKIGDNGKSEVKKGADEECYKKAYDACPVQAISYME